MKRNPLSPPPGRRPAASPERRRFLQLVGASPVLLSGAWWLSGCGSGEDGARNASGGETPTEAPDPPAPPTPEPGEPESGGDAPQAGGEPSQGGSDALVTEIAAVQPTVEALRYTNQSSNPDQRCANCQFYTARTQSRGACQLFPQGLVSAQGWCASWVAKVTS